MLRGLAQLAHRAADLGDRLALLLRGGGDLLHQLAGLLDGRHDLVEQLAGTLCRTHAVAGEVADFLGGFLTALGELAHLGSHHREALAVFTGTRRLDGRVECQQVGLVGDVVDDADLLGDLLHGRDRLRDRLAAITGFLAGLGGHAVGDLGVVAVLRDRSRHQIDRCGGFFHRRSLLAGRLRQALRGGADLVGRTGQGVGRSTHFLDDAGELLAAGIRILLDLIEGALGIAGDALREVAAGQTREHAAHVIDDAGERLAGGVGIGLHLTEGALVVALDALRQVAFGKRAEHAAHVFEDHRGGLHQRVDSGAQLGDRAALAFERNALRQITLAGGGGDGLRLFHGGGQHARGLDLLGDVGGDLDDLEDPTHLVLHRRVDRLDPDFLARLGDALEHIDLRLALVEVTPELGVGVGGRLNRVDEHAVVLADDLVELVAHHREEVLVGRLDVTAQVELDVGVRRVDGRQDAARVLALDFGFGDVVAHAEVLHRLAVVAHDGGDDRIDVIRRAVLGAVLDHAAEDLAAADGGPHLLEDFLGHVGVARGVVAEPDQLVLGVLRDLEEFLVHGQDVALLVRFRHDAGEIHDVGAHLQLGLDGIEPRLDLRQRGLGVDASSFLRLQLVRGGLELIGGLLQFIASNEAGNP